MTDVTYRALPSAASILTIAVAASLAGCAGKPDAVAITPPPPPAAIVVAAPMPAGGYPGMTIPVALPDGQYATPNRALSSSATIWHLRAALNVAALACRGAEQAPLIAAYNAMLTREKTALASAQAAYAAQYRAPDAGNWQDSYDEAQTRLYNFFSQSFARDGFCRAAATTMTDPGFVDGATFSGFAAARLATLEKPFTDFYRAYDAWRGQTPAATVAPTVLIASAATVAPATQTSAPHPRLTIDPSVIADTTVTQ